MKKRTFLAMSMAAALTVGCSSDDITADNGGGVNTDGKSYVGLSITLPSVNGNRSANDQFDMGSADEYKVNDLVIRYLDENGTELKSFKYTADQLIWSTPPAGEGITTTAVLPVEKVPFSGKAYALVEINNPFEGSSIAANSVCDLKSDDKKSADYLTGEDKDDFFMTNTVWRDGHYLVPVTASATENEAQALAGTHTVYVERAAAKVQLDVNAKDKDNWYKATYTVPEGLSNAGAKIQVSDWVLDVTNTKMYPIRKFRGNIPYEQGGLPDDETYKFYRFYSWKNGGYRTYWAEDPNYSQYVENDFNVISEYPENPNALGGVEYCLENTFDVKNQCQNQTTRALIKATYKPVGDEFKLGTTWYTIGNSSTPLSAKALTALVAKAIAKKGVVLQEEKMTAGTKPFVGEMFTISEENLSDEDIAKVKKDLGDLTVYKNGVCYYVVRIKHFGDEICPWGDEPNAPAVSGIKYDEYAKNYDGNRAAYDLAYLGRYGVVRNNWYHLELQSVSGPGTPWIPDPSDPDNPTPPGTDDDEADAYISVKITINPWTYWTQGVDLH